MKAWQGPGRNGRLRRKPCTVLVQGKPRRDIAFHDHLLAFLKARREANIKILPAVV
jgi:hypothetical protein